MHGSPPSPQYRKKPIFLGGLIIRAVSRFALTLTRDPRKAPRVAFDNGIVPLNMPAPALPPTTTLSNETAVGDFAPCSSASATIRPNTPSTCSTKSSRPVLTRNNSSYTRIRRSLAEFTGRFPRSRSRESSSEHNQGRRDRQVKWTFSRTTALSSASSLRATSTINSPETQALIKHEIVPDLDAVSRALDAVNNSSSDSDEDKTRCINQLSTLTARLQSERRDMKTLLNTAVQRDEGKPEICRGLCLEVMNNPLTDAASKVIAYTNLAVLASPRQDARFLELATKWADEQIKDQGEKDALRGIIASSRHSIEQKAAKEGERRLKKKHESEKEEMAAENGSSVCSVRHEKVKWKRSIVEWANNLRLERGLWDFPGEGRARYGGAITKTAGNCEKEMEGARSAKDIICSCGKGGKARVCLLHS